MKCTNSGCFVKQEQWERWRAKRKFVVWVQAVAALLRGIVNSLQNRVNRITLYIHVTLNANTLGLGLGLGFLFHLEIVCAKSCNLVAFLAGNGPQCRLQYVLETR